jgi:hypothetical protein
MSSKIEICNLALNHIGQRTISSLTENTQAARSCSLIYDTVRDSVLRDNAWNFATLMEQLALVSGESVPIWDYLYTYPVQCLFVRKVFNANTAANQLPDEHQEMLTPVTKQKCIATNLELAWIEYTYQVTDPNLYDGNFIDALSYRLASSLAQNISGNIALAKDLMTIYQQVLDRAKLSNAREGVNKRNNYSGLVESR